ncbi:MAG: SGNH/GDSL hydrolase family protein [Candidatus Aminicenantes bacterium]|nr:SGNH/GDSL hydrolase family protein [Candidatus Aminicenantes bacterium]
MIKKIFTRLFVISLAVLFTLLVLEVALRVVYEFRFQPKKKRFPAVTRLYRLSENGNLLYELRPNSGLEIKKRGVKVAINGYGFRDKDYSLEKGEKKRIIFVGDSLTYGWDLNLKDTYHKQLEALFLSQGYAVDVPGMGVVGYNLVQEYHLIKEKALRFDPGIIMLQICPNDFERTLSIKKQAKGKKFLLIPYHDVAVPYVLQKGAVSDFLMRVSYLYKFINLKVGILIKKLDKDYRAKDYFLLGEEEGFRHLKKIKTLLDSKDIKLGAVIFPQRKTGENYRYASLHKKIGVFLDGMGVPYIDLYEKYNVEAPPDIWVDNIHPNAKGNRIAAQVLFDFLLPLL